MKTRFGLVRWKNTNIIYLFCITPYDMKHNLKHYMAEVAACTDCIAIVLDNMCMIQYTQTYYYFHVVVYFLIKKT